MSTCTQALPSSTGVQAVLGALRFPLPKRARRELAFVTFRTGHATDARLTRCARERGITKSRLIDSLVRQWLEDLEHKPEISDAPALRHAKAGMQRLVKSLANGTIEPHEQPGIVLHLSRAVTAVVTPAKKRKRAK